MKPEYIYIKATKAGYFVVTNARSVFLVVASKTDMVAW